MALFTRCCPKCGEALVVRVSASGTRVSCRCRALPAANDNGREPSPTTPAAHVAVRKVETGTLVLALAA